MKEDISIKSGTSFFFLLFFPLGEVVSVLWPTADSEEGWWLEEMWGRIGGAGEQDGGNGSIACEI